MRCSRDHIIIGNIFKSDVYNIYIDKDKISQSRYIFYIIIVIGTRRYNAAMETLKCSKLRVQMAINRARAKKCM